MLGLKSRSMNANRTISLKAAYRGFVLLIALLMSFNFIFFARSMVLANQDAAQELAIVMRLQGAHSDFTRTLEADWFSVTALALQASEASTDTVRTSLAALTLSASKGFLRVEIAGADGTILTSAPQENATKNVSDKAWLKLGLKQHYGALAMQQTTVPDASDGSIVFAAPLRSAAGNTTGVVAAFVDTDYLGSLLKASGQALGLDLFLTTSDGRLIVGSSDAKLPNLGLTSTRAASTGSPVSVLETWPDGSKYFTAILSQSPGDLSPFLGWQLLARIDPEEFAAINRDTVKSLAIDTALMIAALSGMAWIFTLLFLNPLTNLAQSAQRRADGVDEYPFEGNQTREISMISAALTRLEGKKDRT